MSLETFLNGGYQQIGGPSDVTMLNQQGFNDYLSRLYGGMNQSQAGMNGYFGQASSGLGNLSGQYNDYLNRMYGAAGQQEKLGTSMLGSMGSMAGNSAQQYQNLAGLSGNINNFIAGQGNLYGQLANMSGNFNPNAATNQLMSMNPQMARLANQNVNNALSDVYATGRAQAQGAADTARRRAADQLAASGLLNSGAAIQSMTKATAQPIMDMETQLAQTRANAYQQQLAGLQGQAGNLLGQGYQNAANMAQTAGQNQLTGNQLLGNVYGQAGSGLSGLANLYGNTGLQNYQLGQGYQNLAASGLQGLGNVTTGYTNLGNALAGLYGTGLTTGASMNQPYYYTPQYEKTPGLLDWITGIGQTAAGVGSLVTGLKSPFGSSAKAGG